VKFLFSRFLFDLVVLLFYVNASYAFESCGNNNASRPLWLHFHFLRLLAASGCSKKAIKFRIDNPTAQPVSLTIDDKPYEVAPQAETKITLLAGKHTLDSKLTSKVKFIVYADSRGALINPTLNPYIISNEVYATNTTTAKASCR